MKICVKDVFWFFYPYLQIRCHSCRCALSAVCYNNFYVNANICLGFNAVVCCPGHAAHTDDTYKQLKCSTAFIHTHIDREYIGATMQLGCVCSVLLFCDSLLKNLSISFHTWQSNQNSKRGMQCDRFTFFCSFWTTIMQLLVGTKNVIKMTFLIKISQNKTNFSLLKISWE